MTPAWRETRVALDDGAGLVAIELGHQDVAERSARLVIVDLGQRIEAVFGQRLRDRPASENFGTAPDGVAIVHHQDFQP
jgi:hypothetical protein